MNSLHCTFTLFLLITIVHCEENCNRPNDLKAKEEYCWSTEVEIVDRVVQRSRNVLNFAKKKLGIATEEDNDPQKCEYYMCILRQLHMLNANEYPSYDNIKEWAENHVIYTQALEFEKQLNMCHQGLINSTVQELPFYGDQVGANITEDSYDEIQSSVSNEQNPCQISAEYIHCLSRQKQCSVFQYP